MTFSISLLLVTPSSGNRKKCSKKQGRFRQIVAKLLEIVEFHNKRSIRQMVKKEKEKIRI